MSLEDILNADLTDLDCNPLGEKCIRRAFEGVPRDSAIVHRAVAGVLYAMCEYEINRITVDGDIREGRWRTETWDVVRSHAADVMADWLAWGAATDRSLMDIIVEHVGHLRNVAMSVPEWHFPLRDTVVREGRRIPRILDRNTTVVLPLR